MFLRPIAILYIFGYYFSIFIYIWAVLAVGRAVGPQLFYSGSVLVFVLRHYTRHNNKNITELSKVKVVVD